jgi:hypothetical protein
LKLELFSTIANGVAALTCKATLKDGDIREGVPVSLDCYFKK